MNDNDIIKALECCMGCAYKECPYDSLNFDEDDRQCQASLVIDALRLINRLKAENESLKAILEAAEEHYNPLPFKGIFDKKIEEAKTEAIKELAIRFDEIVTGIYNKHIFGYFDLDDNEKEAVMNFSGDITYAFDKLIEEMTEGGDG